MLAAQACTPHTKGASIARQDAVLAIQTPLRDPPQAERHLVVQVVQQAHGSQFEVEIRVRSGSPVSSCPEVSPLKDEGGRHADDAADEGGPRVDGRAVQVLHIAHDPTIAVSLG